MQSGAFERGEQAHNLADRVRDFDGTRHSRRPPMDDPFCADMFYSPKNNLSKGMPLLLSLSTQ